MFRKKILGNGRHRTPPSRHDHTHTHVVLRFADRSSHGVKRKFTRHKSTYRCKTYVWLFFPCLSTTTACRLGATSRHRGILACSTSGFPGSSGVIWESINPVFSPEGTENNIREHKQEKTIQNLKDEVRRAINGETDPLAKLEYVDAVQRLGLGHLFKRETRNALNSICDDDYFVSRSHNRRDDLRAAALRFRLLRQHGYYDDAPQDVFRKFLISEKGDFTPEISHDIEGLLSLYEASFYGFEGEIVMDRARAFAIAHLKGHKLDTTLSPALARKVDQALEMPIRWRPNRIDALWFMEAYEEKTAMNPVLLSLAKLDYSVNQSIHRAEFNRLAGWWSELGLGDMTFSRDNLMEHYLWNVLMVFEPQYGAFREMSAKMTCMITLIDDVYDKIGSVEELEILTRLIDRWDITKADELPPVIRTCFLALSNVIDEVGHCILMKRGIDVNQYLRKVWADQCKAYLVEAKWCHNDSTPALEDYLSNAMGSVGGYIVLLCCFLMTTDDLTEDELNYISRIPNIMQYSTLIVRLNNDLVPSSHRLTKGDQLNAVACIRNQTGASEEEARLDIGNLVHVTWKRLNRDVFYHKHKFAGPFVRACQNLAQASHWVYRHGDGHEVRSRIAKEDLMSPLLRAVLVNRPD